jgi:hypothetical protein
MDSTFTHEDRKRIKEGIIEKYRKVAVSPEGSFKYPTGRIGLEGQNYDPGILKALPEEVLTKKAIGPWSQKEAESAPEESCFT